MHFVCECVCVCVCVCLSVFVCLCAISYQKESFNNLKKVTQRPIAKSPNSNIVTLFFVHLDS